MVVEYHARVKALEDRVPRTFKFYPVRDWWYLIAGGNTEYCTESGHDPNCIKFVCNWYQGFTAGVWGLKTPIRVVDEMPGSNHKLTYFELDAMVRVGWGTICPRLDRFVGVLNADTEDFVWSVGSDQITLGERQWYTNKYNLRIDVSNVKRLDVQFGAGIIVLTGGLDVHFAKILMTVEYVPETPPEPATVSVYVYNRQNGKPVGGARVQLLSGNKVVADGYTGRDGWVTFSGVPAGVEGVSYTLWVLASGYYEYRDAIDVVPGVNRFTIGLTPVPTIPIPWEWIIAGSVVVVGGGVAMALARRR